jgi:hypothetical protein
MLAKANIMSELAAAASATSSLGNAAASHFKFAVHCEHHQTDFLLAIESDGFGDGGKFA